MQYTLVRGSTKLDSRVDLANAAVVGPIKKFNRGSKCVVMYADTIALTRDSQWKLSNVRLAEYVRGNVINYILNGRGKGICWRACWCMRVRPCVQCTDLYDISRNGEASVGGGGRANLVTR